MKAAGKPETATVSCPCGATIEIDLASGDEVFFCPDCRETLQLSVSVDPVTKKKRVGVVLSMGALLTQKGRKGETRVPGQPAAQVHKAKCTCGAQILVDPQSIDSVHSCGKCGAGFTAMLKRGSGPGLSTLVLRPVEAAPVTKAKPAPAPAPRPVAKATSAAPPKPAPKAPPPAPPPRPKPVAAPPPAPAIDAAATPAREQLLTIHKGDMGAQSIAVREDGSYIACFCGKDLKLKGEANREIHKCAECGASYRLFYAFDPRTRSPMVVMLPRAAAK
jgi:hypothetical protein